MTRAILNLDENVPCDNRFDNFAMSLDKTEEQDFMRDMEMKSKGENFEEHLLMR